MKMYFGTDGIRARVGEWPMTPEFVLKLGYAAGLAMTKTLDHPPKVLIGKDTRRSGYLFESSLEAGFTASGCDVILLGPMPSPGVAYLTRALRADLGVVISASHNPHHDNGIKFFSGEGTKLSEALEAEIESRMQEELRIHSPEKVGGVSRLNDARGRYIESCKASLPAFFDLKNFSIVVDCAHGATYDIAPRLFKELGAEVFTIGCAPNGFNINDQVGSTALGALQEEVIARNADLGIAFDGDGDRVLMVDHEGTPIDGDEMLYILARAYLTKGKYTGQGVVGTIMSNMGLELGLQKLDIPFERTKVGDRFVMEKLREKKWFIGGEPSGHIIWLSSTTTGDGIVAALQVLRILKEQKVKLRDLLKDYHKYPQVLINIRAQQKLTEAQWQVIRTAETAAVSGLGHQGRVVIRPSGTEPMIRVMVEAENMELAERAAEQLTDVVSRQFK